MIFVGTDIVEVSRIRKIIDSKGDRFLSHVYDKIEVEYFIVKRKLYENMDFPQKRIQTFIPANGKPSINRVIGRLDEFISDCFDDDGNHYIKEYRKEPSTKNCKWCEFKTKPDICDRKRI